MGMKVISEVRCLGDGVEGEEQMVENSVGFVEFCFDMEDRVRLEYYWVLGDIRESEEVICQKLGGESV